MKRTVILFCVTAAVLEAQTTINGSRTIQGTLDASGAASTKSVKVGNALPGSCSTGELFFNSIAAAGQNLYLCKPDNSWTAISGGSGGGGGGGTSGPVTDTYSMFFTSDSSGNFYVPPNVQSRGAAGSSAHTGADWSALALPVTGNPYVVLNHQLSSTQTGNVGLSLYTVNTQGAVGTSISFLISHYCAGPSTSILSPLAYTNQQTMSFPVLGGNVLSVNNLPVLDLTGCSPGQTLFIKVARDSTSAYPFGYEVLGFVLSESHN